MRKENWFLLSLIIAIFILVLWRPQVSWIFQSFVLERISEPPRDIDDLRSENIKLKTELARFQDIKSQLPLRSPESVVALVYSRYPFNFRNEMLVTVGVRDEILPDYPIIFDGFLIGKIDEVFEEFAKVKTIFDHRWQSAVRIGNRGVDALLTGGSKPRLTLIEKNAEVKAGDVVYNAAPDFPSGLPIAEVKDVELSSDQNFQEATLFFTYEINKVRTVLVLKKNGRLLK